MTIDESMLTHVISDDKNISQFVTHSGVVECHEGRVDDDTHRDEKIDECVHYEQLNIVCEGMPAWRTVPAVDQLRTFPLHVVLSGQSFVEVQETWTALHSLIYGFFALHTHGAWGTKVPQWGPGAKPW